LGWEPKNKLSDTIDSIIYSINKIKWIIKKLSV
jgi:hypothetical protein